MKVSMLRTFQQGQVHSNDTLSATVTSRNRADTMKTVFAVIALRHTLSSTAKLSLNERRVGSGGSLVKSCGGGKGNKGTQSEEVKELHCGRVLGLIEMIGTGENSVADGSFLVRVSALYLYSSLT